MSKEELNCSFCGRAKPQTQLLIAGLDAHICDKCILQAHGIVKEETSLEKEEKKFDVELHPPKQIKAFLEEARSIFKAMIRTVNIKHEVLSHLENISDAILIRREWAPARIRWQNQPFRFFAGYRSQFLTAAFGRPQGLTFLASCYLSEPVLAPLRSRRYVTT